MQQLEAGPSNQSRQEGASHSSLASTSTLSVAESGRVHRLNQAMLAEFRQKADANPDNTPLTKDYCHDVLEELADWLKQQSTYHTIHSLRALADYACAQNYRRFDRIARDINKDFINSGAARVQMGKPNPPSLVPDSDLGLIIKALNLSRHESRIALPPASVSRQDERLIHRLQVTLLGQGENPATLANNIAGFKQFCIWLRQQAVFGTQTPFGLDSPEKLLNHPDEKQVKVVVDSFRDTPSVTEATGDQARTAINKFRKLLGQAPMRMRTYLEAGSTLPQQRPVQPAGKSINIAPPYNPGVSRPVFMAEAAASPGAASEEAGSSRYGVWRPVPGSRGASRQVRPHADTAPRGQTTDIAPPSNPGESGPDFMAEAVAFTDAASNEAGSSRYGVWRSVPRSPDASRNVRQRVDPAPPRQTTDIAPIHSPGVTKPAIMDEEIALLAEPPTSKEEFDFFSKMFR